MRNIRGLMALALSLMLAFLVALVVYRQVSAPRPAPVVALAAEPAPPPEPERFSNTIPDGMRAFSVTVDQVSGLPGDINKNDRVDILATSPLPDKGGSVTRMILQNVRILDMERAVSDNAAGRKTRDRQWTLSLLVTPEQGVTLAAAAASSKIMVLTRGRNDDHSPESNLAVFTTETGIEKFGSSLDASWKENIPAGMRAITVAVRDTDGIAGQLEKGDRVDVIFSCPWSIFRPENSEPGSKGVVTDKKKSSRIIMQNIEILATETTGGLEAGPPESVRLVTLLVQPEQAEILAVATDSAKDGSIRLINRRNDDGRNVATSGRMLQDLYPHKTGKKEYRISVWHGTSHHERYILD